jgi:hypothetical protein
VVRENLRPRRRRERQQQTDRHQAAQKSPTSHDTPFEDDSLIIVCRREKNKRMGWMKRYRVPESFSNVFLTAKTRRREEEKRLKQR